LYAVAVKPVAQEFGGSGVAEYVIDTDYSADDLAFFKRVGMRPIDVQRPPRSGDWHGIRPHGQGRRRQPSPCVLSVLNGRSRAEGATAKSGGNRSFADTRRGDRVHRFPPFGRRRHSSSIRAFLDTCQEVALGAILSFF
jgi:hypothetical protein